MYRATVRAPRQRQFNRQRAHADHPLAERAGRWRLQHPGTLDAGGTIPDPGVRHRRQQAAGVCRAAQEVCRRFERLLVLQREHDHRLFPVAGNVQRLVVFANAVHRPGQVRARRAVGHRIHFQTPLVHGRITVPIAFA